MAKTSSSSIRPLETIQEADVGGSDKSKKAKESPSKSNPFGKSPFAETSLSFGKIVNTSSSATPTSPQPSSQIPLLNTHLLEPFIHLNQNNPFQLNNLNPLHNHQKPL